MLKLLASGPPPSCIVNGEVDDVKLDTYVSNVLVKEGITLDKSKIAYNAGLRAIAKLCLNSFWGKVMIMRQVPQLCHIVSVWTRT